MPSNSQDVNMDMNSNNGGIAKNDSEGGCGRETATDSKETALVGFNEDRRDAFALRDFLGPPNSARVEHNSAPRRDSLPFIDESVDEGIQSEDERPLYRDIDTEDVLSSAACRLRRWRAASRKLRRPRAIAKLESEESGASDVGGSQLLVQRLRGLTAAEDSSSLAPPPAATAPPSPGCLLTPTLADQSTAEYFGSSPECCAEGSTWDTETDSAVPAPPPGPRYKLATEGTLRVCSFQHTRTVVDKILAAKFLRRWETHVLTLHEEYIVSKTPCGLLERPLLYGNMQEVFRMARWDPARKYCLRVVMPQGSLLLQANDVYTRDQWFHSIVWRRNMSKYRKSITKRIRKEEVLKELKNMIDFAMTTPLQDEAVTQAPLLLLTNLLAENEDSLDWEEWAEGAASAAAPLLAERCAGGQLCSLLARLCRRQPRTAPPPALAPPVRRVLTRNVDFARAPHARRLVRDYISALSSHPSGPSLVRRFVEVTHGGGAACPHPRAAPNLAAVALAALDDHYREDGASPTSPAPLPSHRCNDDEDEVLCFADILVHMCEWEDWLAVVAAVLQPVPLCTAALRCPRVASRLHRVLTVIAHDQRCNVHATVTPARTARQDPPCWLKVTAPASPILALPHRELCLLWGEMIDMLLKCCCKRKSFLQDMTKHLPDFLLVALTEHPAAIEVLCLMLEWDVTSEEQTQLEMIAALQSTELGQKHYRDLCDREQNLKRLQAEGGPRRLALPVRATDADVAALLEAGALGNLEYLSLAFTSVTSACAHHLIKLPSLRYLNLWATQFGDSGLQLIAEHLPRLQVLNLCETPVSDKGIEALSALSNLRRLNLNSTKLSAEAFADLKQRLPQLQDYDIRYTEAW